MFWIVMINSNINFIREMRRRKYWKGLVREEALENGATVIKSKDRNLDEIRKLIKKIQTIYLNIFLD